MLRKLPTTLFIHFIKRLKCLGKISKEAKQENWEDRVIWL